MPSSSERILYLLTRTVGSLLPQKRIFTLAWAEEIPEQMAFSRNIVESTEVSPSQGARPTDSFCLSFYNSRLVSCFQIFSRFKIDFSITDFSKARGRTRSELTNASSYCKTRPFGESQTVKFQSQGEEIPSLLLAGCVTRSKMPELCPPPLKWWW